MRFAFCVGAESAVSLPRPSMPSWMPGVRIPFHGRVERMTEYCVEDGRKAAASRRTPNWPRRALNRSKEKVPGNIHGGVEQRGGENRSGLAPGPAVEKAGD